MNGKQKKKGLAILLVALAFAGLSAAQKTDSAKIGQDPLPAPSIFADTIKPGKIDTVAAPSSGSVVTPLPDAAPAAKIRLVKRTYNSRQQVWLAVAMMFFIGLCITSVQSWNPG